MYDSIIILAGGVNKDGSLPDIPKKRVSKGVELYNEVGASSIIMSGCWSFSLDFTPKKTEAAAMKEFALYLGLDNVSIIEEGFSKDTVGNAYFSKQILNKNNWKNIAVVTSDFHANRVRFLFELILGDNYNIDIIQAESGLEDDQLMRLIRTEQKIMAVIKTMFAMFSSKGFDFIIKNVHPAYAKNPMIKKEDFIQSLD